jgi:tetratricopeptide (TPR) repeat protein
VLASLDEKMGGVLCTLGRYTAAVAVLESAAETYRMVSDEDGRWRALAQIGEAHIGAGSPEQGLARLHVLQEIVMTSPPTPGLAALCTTLANLYSNTYQHSVHLTTAARAVDLARAVGNARLLGAALERYGQALIDAGRADDAQPVVEEACRATDATGDLENLAWALADMSQISLQRRDPAAAWTYIERALDAAERRGTPSQIVAMLGSFGELALNHGGDQDRARAALERALSINRQAGLHRDALYPLGLLADLQLSTGEGTSGAGYLEEVAALAGRYQWPWAHWWAGLKLAERDLLDGQQDAARVRLLTLLHEPEGGQVPTANLLSLLAWIQLELGDVTEAAETVAQAVAHNRGNSPYWLSDALRVRALIATRLGRWAEAQSSLEEALSLTYYCSPRHEARLLHAYGLLHAAQGEPAAAAEKLEAALALFQHLGARRDVLQVERALGALQRR